MAKKGSYGYRAGLERKKAQRRIEWHERILSRQNLPTRTRERHESEIRDLKAAQEATRQRTKSGKVISGRSDAEKMDANLKKLESMNKRATMYSKASERSMKAATLELNKASVGDKSSRFSKQEAQVFYRATQPAWQRAGVSITERNEEILAYYGRTNLAEFVEEVIEANKIAIRAAEVMPEEELSEESKERYDNEADVQDKPDYHYGKALDKIMEQMRDYIFEPERQ